MSTSDKQPCKIFATSTLAERRVILPKGNSLHLQTGATILVISSDGKWRQTAQVTLDESSTVSPEDKDNIQSSKWTGDDKSPGTYEAIRVWRYRLDVLRTSKRAWVGLLLAAIAVALAYANAALQKDGSVQFDLGAYKWIIFAFTALTSFVTWARDTWL
jgi:hypothetical protein